MIQTLRLPAPVQGLLRWGLAATLLTFVAFQLRAQWEQLHAQTLSFSWPWLCLATLGLMAFFTLSAEGWRRLLGGLGTPMRLRDAFSLLFSSNLAKYLPGGVWNMVGRVALAQRLGVPAAHTSTSLVLEIAFQVTSVLLVALLTLPAFAGHAPVPALWMLVAAAALVIVGIHPYWMNLALALAERVLKRPMPRLEISYRFMLGMLGYYTFNWLLLGASFAALGQALHPAALSPLQAAMLVGSFGIAWNVGVFAFFFPAGLGVREVALVTLLAGAFPPAWPAVLALVARVWILLGEVACFAIAMALRPAAQPDA